MPASRMAKYKTLVQQLAVGFALLPLTAVDATWLWNVVAVVGRRAGAWSAARSTSVARRGADGARQRDGR